MYCKISDEKVLCWIYTRYQLPHTDKTFVSEGPSIIIIIYAQDNFYRKREEGGWKMMIDNIYMYIDYCHKRRKGGGQRVMIENIIRENYDNDGRPLKRIFIWKSFWSEYSTYILW